MKSTEANKLTNNNRVAVHDCINGNNPEKRIWIRMQPCYNWISSMKLE